MDFVIFIAAMSALIYGADFIIKESERIALHFKISHFVIGATLIAFGTSLPEMAASMMASHQGKSDMAVANVVGSVIFNITLVLKNTGNAPIEIKGISLKLLEGLAVLTQPKLPNAIGPNMEYTVNYEIKANYQYISGYITAIINYIENNKEKIFRKI